MIWLIFYSEFEWWGQKYKPSEEVCILICSVYCIYFLTVFAVEETRCHLLWRHRRRETIRAPQRYGRACTTAQKLRFQVNLYKYHVTMKYIVLLAESYTLSLMQKGSKRIVGLFRDIIRTSYHCAVHLFVYLPAHAKFPVIPNPAPIPVLRPSLTGRLATVPCALTPATILSRLVSITTPPIIISESVACSVSKLKMRSSSQTFSNNLSRAST